MAVQFAGEDTVTLRLMLTAVNEFVEAFERRIGEYENTLLLITMHHDGGDAPKLLSDVRLAMESLIQVAAPTSLVDAELQQFREEHQRVMLAVGEKLRGASIFLDVSAASFQRSGDHATFSEEIREFASALPAQMACALIPAIDLRDALITELRTRAGGSPHLTEKQVARRQRDRQICKLKSQHPNARAAELLNLAKSDPLLSKRHPLLPPLNKEIIRKIKCRGGKKRR